MIAVEIPSGYCQCGCGQKTELATRSRRYLGTVKGEPLRWLRGHNPTPPPPRNGFVPRRPPAPPLREGDRFGLQAVIRLAYVKAGYEYYEVQCDCGSTRAVRRDRLVSGVTRSCGCWANEQLRTRLGLSRSPEYGAWKALVRRCTNPRDANWSNYGGRGITVCDRWRSSFEAFLADMGERAEWATGGIGRIDNDGNYEPGNCRWETAAQQASNRRRPVRKGSA